MSSLAPAASGKSSSSPRSFQLIRGGRDPALQVRPTLSVLELLAGRRLIPAATESELREAYIFLRRLEHRLQYVEDQQTHRLPDDPGDRGRIAPPSVAPTGAP